MSEPETGNNQDTVEARAMAGGGTGSMQSKETPILQSPTITYGLQDTHTTILPLRFYMSAIKLTGEKAVTLNLVLNDLDQQPIITTSFLNGDASAASAPDNSLTNIKCYDNDMTTAANFGTFPWTITTTNPKPFYWEYFSDIYSYYTVLGCEYEITFRPSRNNHNDILLAHSIESGGTDTTGVNREPPQNELLQYLVGYKNLQYEHIAGRDAKSGTSNNFYTLKGYHKTGTTKRDVTNDGDVKTWSKVGGVSANVPTNKYREYLHLNIFKHPLAGVTAKGGCNIEIQLKYTVQFKQLDKAAMYPTTSYGYTKVQTLPTDAHPDYTA